MAEVETNTTPVRPLLDFADIVAILWHRKFLIATTLAIAIAIAVAYLATTTPTYTARSVIILDPREPKATSTTTVLGNIGSDSAAVASQVNIINSDSLLRPVFDKENLAADPEFSKPGLLSQLLGGGRVKSDDVVFETFRKHVSVEREGLTYIITIGFSSSDPQKAARIANAIVSAYISEQVSEKSAINVEISGKLADRVASLRNDVSDAEGAVERFMAEHDIYDTGAGRTLLDKQIEQTNAELAEAMKTKREAESRYAQAKAIGTSPGGLARLTEILKSESADRLRNTYYDRAADLARARTRLGAGHPARQSLEAEVTNLTTLMSGEAERIIAELKASAELATSNVERIQKDLDELRTRSEGANLLAVQLRELERNAEASRQVLEQFLNRFKETSESDELQRPDARIVSSAKPPVKAEWPRPKLLLGAAGALGLLAGCGLALLAGTPASMVAARNALRRPNEAPKYEDDHHVEIERYRRAEAMSRERQPVPDRSAPKAAPAAKPATSAVSGLAAPIISTLSGFMRRSKSDSAKWSGNAGDDQALIQYGPVETRFVPPFADTDELAYARLALREMLDEPDGRLATQASRIADRVTRGLNRTCPVIQFLSPGHPFDKRRLAHALAIELRNRDRVPLLVDLDADTAAVAPAVTLGELFDEPPELDRLTDNETGQVAVRANATNLLDHAPATAAMFNELRKNFDAIFLIGNSHSAGRLAAARWLVDQTIVVIERGNDSGVASRELGIRGAAGDGGVAIVEIAYGADRSDDVYADHMDFRAASPPRWTA